MTNSDPPQQPDNHTLSQLRRINGLIMLDKAERLKIIFLTDIHLNMKALAKLGDWVNLHYNSEPKFDYCFVGGDTANCDHQKLNHSEEEMHKSTIEVHKIIKEMLCCKIFSIPGNHDCQSFFNPAYQIDGFYNMHNKRIEISSGLELIGFGGAGPGLVDGNEVWSGYPYKSQKQIETQFKKYNTFGETNKLAQQTILLTHQGPQLSETSCDRSQHPSRSITAGSYFLNELYNRKDIVGWFHGHTHQGSNYSKVSGIQVFNPGPMALGRFMYFELVKEQMKWRMGRKVFEVL